MDVNTSRPPWNSNPASMGGVRVCTPYSINGLYPPQGYSELYTREITFPWKSHERMEKVTGSMEVNIHWCVASCTAFYPPQLPYLPPTSINHAIATTKFYALLYPPLYNAPYTDQNMQCCIKVDINRRHTSRSGYGSTLYSRQIINVKSCSQKRVNLLITCL